MLMLFENKKAKYIFVRNIGSQNFELVFLGHAVECKKGTIIIIINQAEWVGKSAATMLLVSEALFRFDYVNVTDIKPDTCHNFTTAWFTDNHVM